MAPRERSKTTITMPAQAEPAAPPEAVPENYGQRKRPEAGRYRLLVDRQLKGSYTSSEAAEAAGLAIKQGHPVVQVAIYDATDEVNKDIELPKA